MEWGGSSIDTYSHHLILLVDTISTNVFLGNEKRNRARGREVLIFVNDKWFVDLCQSNNYGMLLILMSVASRVRIPVGAKSVPRSLLQL